MVHAEKHSVRIDVTYDADNDVFELCYQEHGQLTPTVLKMTRGYEQHLSAAASAMIDAGGSMVPWKFTIMEESSARD